MRKRHLIALAPLFLACSSSTTSRTLFAEADSGSGGSGSLTGHDAGMVGSGGDSAGGPDSRPHGDGSTGDAPQIDSCLEGCRNLCLTRWPAAPYPCWDRPISTGSALCTCAYESWREATEGCYGVIDPTVHLPRSELCQ